MACNCYVMLSDRILQHPQIKEYQHSITPRKSTNSPGMSVHCTILLTKSFENYVNRVNQSFNVELVKNLSAGIWAQMNFDTNPIRL